jgi:DNA-binding NtrC family response regulator
MKRSAIKKILIVDDEQSVLLSLSHVLKAKGVEVISCDEIAQAQEALEHIYFDLVITDIRMSGVESIEGLELLRYIKQHYDTEVIIMTGYGSAETKNEAYRCGVLHYFTKPVDIREVLGMVASIGIPVKNIYLKPQPIAPEWAIW